MCLYFVQPKKFKGISAIGTIEEVTDMDVKKDFSLEDKLLNTYITPEVEIMEFDTEDVITTSPTSSSDNNSMPWIPLN